ncbi:MAG: hypothetical protein U5K35_10100 [Rhodohalobacter sp.]|nr:hypothetical protein [Rhodohalobacter sp.]
MNPQALAKPLGGIQNFQTCPPNPECFPEQAGLGFMACEETTRPIFFSALPSEALAQAGLIFYVSFVSRQKVRWKPFEI